MTLPYCIQEIQEQLDVLPLPNAKFLADFLVALITCQKLALNKIAHAMPGEAKPASQEQRIRRYLDLPRLCFAAALAKLLPAPAPWVLAVDRTNWKRAGTDINYLVLAVIIGNTAVPLLWQVLKHPGNSDTAERIVLLERFLERFGTQSVRLITADREFIGGDWLAWLVQQQLPFCVRIRCTDLLTHADGHCDEACTFFERACRCRKLPFLLWNQRVFAGGKRLSEGDWLIVVSNREGDLLGQYRHRWGIETLFQALKKRGFDLESSCTTRPGPLLGLLSLCYVWCLRTGLFLCGTEPLPLLKHGRAAQSWFRRGLDYLHRLLAPLSGRPHRAGFDRALLLLRPVPLPAKLCL
jgi:hypothetical protein